MRSSSQPAAGTPLIVLGTLPLYALSLIMLPQSLKDAAVQSQTLQSCPSKIQTPVKMRWQELHFWKIKIRRRKDLDGPRKLPLWHETRSPK